MCLAAIAWARIPTVYFGNDYKATSEIGFDDKPIYQFMMKKPSKIKVKMIHINSRESAELYKEWANKTDKRMY
jgi:tRNA(Arg) A34 adenosine deaminase TadA